MKYVLTLMNQGNPASSIPMQGEPPLFSLVIISSLASIGVHGLKHALAAA